MKKTNFEWLINDCFVSIDRLERANTEMDWILEEQGQELIFLDEIAVIKELLNQLKNNYSDYETRRDITGDIYYHCLSLSRIWEVVGDILTNENYHPHNRILENEPLQISSNINEINNARLIS